MIAFLSEFDETEARRWFNALSALLPQEQIVAEPADLAKFADTIDVAVVANPSVDVWSRLPQLRFVQSLWAGVDRLIGVVPSSVVIARLVDPDLTSSMVASVVAHVLRLHLQHDKYALFQREHKWQPLEQPATHERRVVILGLGALGTAAALALVSLGFQVSGWSHTAKTIPGVASLTGERGLDELLGQADIVVNLLPLTEQTSEILGESNLGKLPRGASVINVGRGAHVDVAALLQALTSSQVGHAILDVFDVEPLPPDHALWAHDRVTLLPHVAAQTSLASACEIAAANIGRFRSGAPLRDVVDRARGY